jgi:uncharacterized protein YgiB involved in biofilm formation
MKRSRHVALALLGTAAALSGCDGRDAEGTIFQSLADCRQFYDEDICRTKASEAETLHAQTAPKYQSKAACEAAFGGEACVETPTPPPGQEQQASSSSWFMPAMMGFMLGRALSPPVPLHYGPPSAAGPAPQPGRQPVYSAGNYVGSAPAGATRARWSANAPASPRVAALAPPARGGFGATGRGYSGGAGS